jgi:hypothetical protein
MTDKRWILTILGGYALAVLAAFVVVEIYVAATAGPDRDTYAGMYAFGDALLFVAVLGVAALPPTAAALWRLCRKRR